MAADVILEKQTTGTEADRILDAYLDLRPQVGPRSRDGKRLVLHFANADYAAARAQLEEDLRSISTTWAIHLVVLEPV